MVLAIGLMAAGCAGRKPALRPGQAAVVNGKAITQAELTTRMMIYQVYFKKPLDDPASKQQILDSMVRDRLVREQADKQGVTVSDAQVEAEMAKFFGALDRQYQSRDEVNKQLQTLGLTNEDIAAFLKDFLINQAVVGKQRAGAQVSDDERKAYYEQNKASAYTFNEDVVRAAHVLVPLDQEAKAREVAAKAKAGGDFAELARLYSVDPGSAQQCGDLGYFTRGTMVKEFADPGDRPAGAGRASLREGRTGNPEPPARAEAESGGGNLHRRPGKERSDYPRRTSQPRRSSVGLGTGKNE